MHRKIFLVALPLLFLTATFEHCYYILSLYNGGLILPVVTTTLLVIAIDASIYFSMQFINLLPARIILIMSGTISFVLNVKYMLDWKPPGVFALIIGITVGFLIPAMLGLFGWLEKEIRENTSVTHSNGHLREVVKFHVEKYPDKKKGLRQKRCKPLLSFRRNAFDTVHLEGLAPEGVPVGKPSTNG